MFCWVIQHSYESVHLLILELLHSVKNFATRMGWWLKKSKIQKQRMLRDFHFMFLLLVFAKVTEAVMHALRQLRV